METGRKGRARGGRGSGTLLYETRCLEQELEGFCDDEERGENLRGGVAIFAAQGVCFRSGEEWIKEESNKQGRQRLGEELGII